MIYDVFTYNGEREMLKLRLGMLYNYVDKFIIVEAKTTFSGHRKPLYYFRTEAQFKPWWPKIEFFTIDEKYSPAEIALAKASPNTVGAEHWTREFLQKESIKKALTHLKDDDVVYIGDVDEIWDYTYVPTMPLEKLLLKVYAYYLNNHSTELFWGTLVGSWGALKEQCLNHVRSDVSLRGMNYGGWHFTSMGGFKEVKRKLDDSYTRESYNTKAVQNALAERLKKGEDYLGRPFHFTIDESEWPHYLVAHRDRFTRLLK